MFSAKGSGINELCAGGKIISMCFALLCQSAISVYFTDIAFCSLNLTTSNLKETL
jgi:hypothetical protein